MNPVILAAKRTPIGSFLGAFKDIPAVELGVIAARSALQGLNGGDVADVLVGNVLQAAQGMNPARQIALRCGLPDHVPGQTINRVCGSGMQAVVSACQGLRSGDGHLYLAGGIESMSRAPYLLPHLRAGHKMGNAMAIDSMVHDGLTDPAHHYHMGMTAENVAVGWKITREEQDAFALESHRKAVQAETDGFFQHEMVPVEVYAKRGSIRVEADESVRRDSSLEALAQLKPVFKQPDGTVTAGNASGLSDGAAMVALADEDYARANGHEVLGHILAYSIVGVDPAVMGIGPAAAIPAALRHAGISIGDIDLIELNEAFAAQSIAVCRDLQLDAAKVNISGGAIALGHPIGASGARIVVTLLHALRASKKELGVASLCIGGGMGMAMVLRAG